MQFQYPFHVIHTIFPFISLKQGRAGRFGSQWENGFVTTHKSVDLPTLKFLLGEKPEPIEHAGLQLTSDQIEIYAFHLPNAPISNLIVSSSNAIPEVPTFRGNQNSTF